MGEEVLKKFGKYFLLDRIAQGGMAEIYRARLAASDGAGRLLVIKRVMAGYGTNAEFLEMFKSEIKVTMGFNHPNIVQLYDFGEEQGQPYIAMEFVDGRNVRQFISRFAEQKQLFPIEFAVWVVEQCAAGLHYAHSFKDKITGDPLSIVHRDISPQNILISYEGNAKVIDFGIAKAATNSEATRAGVIKGKPSYLSPEQISGEVLDGRSDMFALGIVLWEMLTGRKLFAAPGENEFAVLKLIESCQTYVKPPSTYNPEVPKDLDYIVLKCLAKQRDKRFATAEELQRTLHKFLYAYSPDFSPSDLAYCAKDLFKNDIVEDRKKLQKLNGKVEQLMSTDIPEMPAPVEEHHGAPVKKEDTTTVVHSPKKPVSTFGVEGLNTKVEIEMPAGGIQRGNTPSPGSRGHASQRGPSGGGAGRAGGGAPHPTIPQSQVAPRRKSGGGGGLFKVGVAAAGILAVLALFGPDFGGKSRQGNQNGAHQNGRGMASQGQPHGNHAAKAAPAANTVLLKLRLVPSGGTGTQLAINGVAVNPSEPMIRVPLDQPLELVAERPGFRLLKREFVVESRQVNGLEEWEMDVQLTPVRFGFLTIHTTPSANAVVRGMDENSRGLASDAAPWTLRTPIENEKFPVGVYNIVLENTVLGMEKVVNVTIEEGRAVSLSERLEIKR
ncbi:MAG: serine/threonine protein kinase [Bdellovibrionales bacterium]|nr:serine/threonine protein kinase [Bdellovibrionales bacterium]